MSVRTGVTILGTAIGFAFGAPQLGFLAGSLIGNAIDPVKVYGPRLGDAKGMFCREGVPIPFGQGIFRCDGTLIACKPGDADEHEHEEGGKGGGPENVTYTYTRTFAVLACESLSPLGIAGYRRIWEGDQLVYDATPAPTQADAVDEPHFLELLAKWAEGQSASKKFIDNTTFYYGSDDQMPDPELEALFGVGQVSPFRDWAYIVRKDADVTKWGKSIPQYSFEIATAVEVQATNLVGWWKLDDTLSEGIARDSSISANDGEYHADAVYAGPITGSSLGSSAAAETAAMKGGAFVLHAGAQGVGTSTAWAVGCSFRYEGENTEAYFKDIFACWNSYVFGRANFLIGLNETLHVRAYYSEAVSEAARAVTSLDPITPGRAYRVWLVRDGGSISLYLNGDLEGTTVLDDETEVAVTGDRIHFGNYLPPIDLPEFFLGQISDCMILSGPMSAGEIAADYVRFRPLTGSEVGVPGSDYTVTPEGDIVSPDSVDTSLYPQAVSLATAITTLCTRDGILTADDLDVTGVPDFNMIGWMIARQANIDACLRPLLDAGFCTMYEADGKLVFVALGGDSVVTITADDLVAQEEGPLVRETRAQEVERPRKVIVQYSDPATYFIPTTQDDERLTSDVRAVGERTVELASVVLDQDQAKQIAHKLNKASWVDLLGGKDFALPGIFSYLTPADVVQLDYRGRQDRLRLETTDDENRTLAISARQDRAHAYVSTKTGTGPLPSNYPTLRGGPTIGALLDVRPLRDADDKVGFYVAACGVLGGWDGCRFQISADPTLGYPLSVDISTRTVMGVLTAELPVASVEVPDETNTLTVQLYGGLGSLSSVTFDQLMTEQNGFALVADGNVVEVGQFQTATLVSPGVYALTMLIRGRLGTEPATHPVGTQFVLLDNLHFVECDRSWIGKELTCRPVSFGTVDADNATFTSDFAGMTQVEMAPIAFNATRDGSDNVEVSWVGVGRLGTPLQAFHGVFFTGYRLTFSDGVDTFAKETTSQFYSYSAAAQTIDFGSAPASLDVTIQQINSITGASDALEGTV